MPTESSTQEPVPLSHFLRVPLSTTVPLSHPGVPAFLDWTLGRQKEGTLCAGWLAKCFLPSGARRVAITRVLQWMDTLVPKSPLMLAL